MYLDLRDSTFDESRKIYDDLKYFRGRFAADVENNLAMHVRGGNMLLSLLKEYQKPTEGYHIIVSKRELLRDELPVMGRGTLSRFNGATSATTNLKGLAAPFWTSFNEAYVAANGLVYNVFTLRGEGSRWGAELEKHLGREIRSDDDLCRWLDAEQEHRVLARFIPGVVDKSLLATQQFKLPTRYQKRKSMIPPPPSPSLDMPLILPCR